MRDAFYEVYDEFIELYDDYFLAARERLARSFQSTAEQYMCSRILKNLQSMS